MRISCIQNHSRKAWVVDLGLIEGKRKRKFFYSKSLAERYLRAKRIEKERFGETLLALSDNDRSSFVAAKQRLDSIGITISEVIDFWEKSRVERKRQTVAKAIGECLDDKRRAGLRPRSLDSLASLLSRFGFGRESKMMDEISQSELSDFIHNPNYAKATQRSVRIDLLTFFSWGVQKGYVSENPVQKIPPVLIDDHPPVILTPAQADKLIRTTLAIKPKLIPFVTLCMFCGLRPSETYSMRWANVHADRGFVETVGSKTRSLQRRIVELSGNAKKWLSIGGELPPVNTDFHMPIVRRECGLLDLWAQDIMRHSFASYHLAMHGSADKTATQLGHRSTSMLFLHYRELVTKDDAIEFWGISP